MLFLFRSAPEVEKRIHSKLFRKFWRSRGTKEPAYITVLRLELELLITEHHPPSTECVFAAGGCLKWFNHHSCIRLLQTSHRYQLLWPIVNITTNDSSSELLKAMTLLRFYFNFGIQIYLQYRTGTS